MNKFGPGYTNHLDVDHNLSRQKNIADNVFYDDKMKSSLFFQNEDPSKERFRLEKSENLGKNDLYDSEG